MSNRLIWRVIPPPPPPKPIEKIIRHLFKEDLKTGNLFYEDLPSGYSGASLYLVGSGIDYDVVKIDPDTWKIEKEYQNGKLYRNYFKRVFEKPSHRITLPIKKLKPDA